VDHNSFFSLSVAGARDEPSGDPALFSLRLSSSVSSSHQRRPLHQPQQRRLQLATDSPSPSAHRRSALQRQPPHGGAHRSSAISNRNRRSANTLSSSSSAGQTRQKHNRQQLPSRRQLHRAGETKRRKTETQRESRNKNRFEKGEEPRLCLRFFSSLQVTLLLTGGEEGKKRGSCDWPCLFRRFVRRRVEQRAAAVPAVLWRRRTGPSTVMDCNFRIV